MHRASWLAVLAWVTLACDAALLWRRWTGKAAPFRWQPGRRRLPAWHVAVFAAAVVIAIGAVGLARVGAAIQPQPGFTQLWLSSRGVGASDIKIGVTNDEGRTTGYRLVLMRNGKAGDDLEYHPGQRGQLAADGALNRKSTLAANLYRLPDLTTPTGT